MVKTQETCSQNKNFYSEENGKPLEDSEQRSDMFQLRFSNQITLGAALKTDSLLGREEGQEHQQGHQREDC